MTIKKIIKNLIFTFFALMTINAGHCYTLNYNELYSNIYSNVYCEIKQNISKYSSDFEIKLTGIPKEAIYTNDATKPKIEIISQNPQGNTFSPNLYKRIYIKDSKNNIIKSFPINIQTKVYKEVLIANEIIPFGVEINSNNTELKRCEISRNLTNVLIEIPKGLISKRNYQKGSMILANSVKAQSIVLKNSLINIRFLSAAGLEIKLQGLALKDGAVGEIILVKSQKYNKTYNAVVDSASQVTVKI